MAAHSYAKAGWRLFDVFGQEVKPGNWVTYPNRRGSGVWMEEARVLKVGTGERNGRKFPTVKAEKADGRRVTLTTALDRMVKAPDGWQPDAFS